MKSSRVLLFIINMVIFTPAVFAGTGAANTQAAVEATRWKASFSSSFYEFYGAQPAKFDLYSFDRTTLALQLATISYQATPNWTLLMIGQHLNNYVETNVGALKFRDRTEGAGDLIFSALRPVEIGSSVMLLADMGASLPTGSINKDNESAPSTHYAYNMQLGSGTVDALLGLTLISLAPQFQVGAHLGGIFRNGTNANGYRLGDQYKFDYWWDFPIGMGVTPRIVGYYKFKRPIGGEDSTLPRSDYTEFYYHNQINWDTSLALKCTWSLGRASLSAEVGAPVYQGSINYDDVAVYTRYYGTLSVAGAF
jgi:hypothetical protein